MQTAGYICKDTVFFLFLLVYLDIGEGEFNQGVLDFNFDTSASAVGRSFEIKVSQIKCESPNR